MIDSDNDYDNDDDNDDNDAMWLMMCALHSLPFAYCLYLLVFLLYIFSFSIIKSNFSFFLIPLFIDIGNIMMREK